MMKQLALSIALVGAASSTWGIENHVEVTGGKISGMTENGVQAFKGVPFAAPPVGDLRWRPPQAVVPWDGVKACAEFGPSCPQSMSSASSFYAFTNVEEIDEDCLFLNVWTAAESAAERRPVMVWFHGGGLTRCSGSDARFNGANLAKKGVVIVTVNYRLGAFGYLAHPELTREEPKGVSGNYGVLDQIESLRWVQQNIAQFGGDPGNVTVFGQSAGSWSVQAMVSSPLAKGLIHRAIGHSGGLFGSLRLLDESEGDKRSGHQIGEDFLEACGVKTIAEARALSSDEILKSFHGAGRRFYTRPVVDGWVIPEPIEDIFQNGRQNDVPIIVGTTAKEMSSLTSPAGLPNTTAELKERISRHFPNSQFSDFVAAFGGGDDDTARNAILALIQANGFSSQMRQWARATDNVSSAAFVYYFTRVPPIENSEYLGAYHSSDVPYAFQNIDPEFGKVDQAVSDVMSDYWVNFAKTGDPNGTGLPKWESYNIDAEPYMELGDTPSAGNHWLKKEFDFLEMRDK